MKENSLDPMHFARCGMVQVIDHADMVANLLKPGEEVLATLTPAKCDLLHAAFGVGTESGELQDAVKKHIFYNREVDRANVVEELGDLEFYLQAIRNTLRITRQEVLIANLEKLTKGKNARYKDGYSDAAAIARADKEVEIVDHDENDHD